MAYIRAHDTNRRRNGKAVKRYEVCWREQATDANGLPTGKFRARQESYPTRELAEARRDELNNAKHNVGGTSALADARKAAARPFAEYATGWLAAQRRKHAEGALKIGTLDNYERLTAHYVLPVFGHRPVGSITLTDCEEFRADLATRLKPRSVRNAWLPFAAILRYAVRAKALPASPADAIERGNSDRSARDTFKPHPLTAPQVAALAAKVGEISHPVYELVVLFLCYTGLRRGELQGLQLHGLTLTHAATGVCGSVRVTQTRVRRKGELLTGSPKSAKGTRSVPLPGWLAERMADYLTSTHERADDPTAPLFPNRRQGGARRKGEHAAAQLDWAEPVELRSFARRTLRDACEAVGIPVGTARKVNDDGCITPPTNGFRLHDTRHTAAVAWLTAGVHFMQVSKWLGHADYVITMSVYADYRPEEDTPNPLPEPVAPPAPATNVVPLRSTAQGR